MLKKISPNEIVRNHEQFNLAMKRTDSIPYIRFSNFSNWYYFPKYRTFSPSKFIGYKGTTVINYKGWGNAGETTKVLDKFFYEVDRNTRAFTKLKAKLDLFAFKLNKKINKKTYEGYGGIYLPNREFLNQVRNQDNSLSNTVKYDLEAQKDEDTFSSTSEGKRKQILVNYYERQPRLRIKAIKIHGMTCKVCGFDFQNFYGKLGKQYIEVHHLKPLSRFVNEKYVDPKSEMTVLCSNCHRMIHRRRNKIISVQLLKKIIKRNDVFIRSSVTIPRQ